MVLTFYSTGSPSIKLNKDLGSPVGSTNSTPNPTGEVDVINPVFILNYNVPADANYVVAGAPLNRSYFITDISYTIAKTCVVTCHVDVLGTNANKINNTTLNFIRGAEDVNEIEDTSYPLSDVVKRIALPFTNFPSGFFTDSDDGKRYLLRIADGRERNWDSDTDDELTLGDFIIYRGIGYELLGSNYKSAYIDPNSSVPGPSTGFPVAEGTIFYITQTIDGQLYYQDYVFLVRDVGGEETPYIQIPS